MDTHHGNNNDDQAKDKLVDAAVILIGDEVLSGRTQDLNLNHIAKTLGEIGIQIGEARVIPDIPERIIDTVNELRARHNYVFTTGGIGPTHDDITADCIAAAFGVGIGPHPEALRRLETHYEGSGIEFNEARHRMTRIPDGASLIDNPVSAAPGFVLGNVHVMAGIPKIMQAMLEGVLPTLAGGAKVHSLTITGDVPEGSIANHMEQLQADNPGVTLGLYPYYSAGKAGVSVVARGTDLTQLEQVSVLVSEHIRAAGGEIVERPA